MYTIKPQSLVVYFLCTKSGKKGVLYAKYSLQSAFTAFCHGGISIVYIQRSRKGVAILISVVIGALLLAGLYTLFGDTILPTLTQKISGLFNYKG